MGTIYKDELGECFASRGELGIYKEPKYGMLAVYSFMPEFTFSETGEIVYGSRIEAIRIGYVSDLANAEIAFDAAETELAWAVA